MIEDTSRPARDAALADLNGDGLPEWLVAGADVRVYSNEGGRLSATEQQRIALPTDDLEVADLDRDGMQDVILAAAPPSSIVRVLYNVGGALRNEQDYPIRACGAAEPPPRIVVADLNDDGLPDLAVNGSAAILVNRGKSFEYRYIAGVTPCFGGSSLTAADTNDDGTIDLAWLNADGVRVLLNSGGARFRAGGQNQALSVLPLASRSTIAAGYRRIPSLDMNGDGARDLLLGPSILLAPSPPISACGATDGMP